MIFKKIILGLMCYILFACAKTNINNSVQQAKTSETLQKLQPVIEVKKPLTTAQLQQNLQSILVVLITISATIYITKPNMVLVWF